MRYFRLLNIFFKNSLQIELEYRLNLIFDIIHSLILSASGILILYVMFDKAESVGGWSFSEAITLYGVFMIMEAIVDIAIHPNLNKIPEYIRTGNMDFYLIKPLSSQFISSLRHYSFWTIPQFVLGFFVMIYGVLKSGQLNLVNIPISFLFLLSGLGILYSLGLILSTLSFWFVKIDNIHQLIFAFMSAARVPVSAYSGPIRFMFSFIVPVAFVTTVPAQAALGKLNLGFAMASIVVSIGLLLTSHLFWRYAVANYSSASS